MHGLRTVSAALLLSLLAVAGCEEQGPAERAGERLDDALSQAGERLEDAREEAEEAAEEVREALRGE